jgi:hypothetical protein
MWEKAMNAKLAGKTDPADWFNANRGIGTHFHDVRDLAQCISRVEDNDFWKEILRLEGTYTKG